MKELRRKDGFTLIEMLIVVAIVAILIAVSIPLVGSSLERARKATDAANERAAKAEIVLCYMTGSEWAPGQKVFAYDDSGAGVPERRYYAYDAANGKLVQARPAGYGKCDKHKDQYLIVWIKKSGDVFMLWTGANNFLPAAPPENYGNDGLCGPTLND